MKKDYVCFRNGELSFDGWKITNHRDFVKKMKSGGELEGSDFSIKVTQKGVDIKMGLDIAWLATKKIVDILVVMTTDIDMVPAMEFARKEGLTVFLATFGKKPSWSLIEHSDRVLKKPKK